MGPYARNFIFYHLTFDANTNLYHFLVEICLFNLQLVKRELSFPTVPKCLLIKGSFDYWDYPCVIVRFLPYNIKRVEVIVNLGPRSDLNRTSLLP